MAGWCEWLQRVGHGWGRRGVDGTYRVRRVGQAKVGEHDVAVAVQQRVGRLDVAVDHVARVQVFLCVLPVPFIPLAQANVVE